MKFLEVLVFTGMVVVDGLRMEANTRKKEANEHSASESQLHAKDTLLPAVKSGHLKQLRNMLQNTDIDPNQEVDYGLSVLMYAIELGLSQSVEVLLQCPNVDVNIADPELGETALMLAVDRDVVDHALVKELCKLNADINKKSAGDWTALMFASRRGQLSTVRTFLEHGVDIDATNDSGQTALMIAIARGQHIVAEELCERDTDVNCVDKQGNTALMFAVLHDYPSRPAVVKQLLKCSQLEINHADKDGNTALMMASGNGTYELVRELLKHPNICGDQINNYGETALTLACDRGHCEIVRELLLCRGVEANQENADGWSALKIASFRKDAVVVDALVSSCSIDPSNIPQFQIGFHEIRPSADAPPNLLQTMVADTGIVRVMNEYGFRVGILMDACIKADGCIHGGNHSNGRKIELNISGSLGFRKSYVKIVAVLLHELAHNKSAANSCSNHPVDFWTLYASAVKTYLQTPNRYCSGGKKERIRRNDAISNRMSKRSFLKRFCGVRLQGIKSVPFLNGLEGTLWRKLPDGRWVVIIFTDQPMNAEAQKLCAQLKYEVSLPDTEFELLPVTKSINGKNLISYIRREPAFEVLSMFDIKAINNFNGVYLEGDAKKEFLHWVTKLFENKSLIATALACHSGLTFLNLAVRHGWNDWHDFDVLPQYMAVAYSLFNEPGSTGLPTEREFELSLIFFSELVFIGPYTKENVPFDVRKKLEKCWCHVQKLLQELLKFGWDLDTVPSEVLTKFYQAVKRYSDPNWSVQEFLRIVTDAGATV